jgi:hypothetical protein
MDEVAEDGQRRGAGVLESEIDSVTNAETHAEVGRSNDFHFTT